jgi:hypothetical protein
MNLLYLSLFLMFTLLEMSAYTTGEDSSRSFLFETYSAIATFQEAASQLLSLFNVPPFLTHCDFITKAFLFGYTA